MKCTWILNASARLEGVSRWSLKCGCNEIAASLYHRLAAIEANFWRETLTSDCKEIWTSGGCLTATSLELKLNGNSTSN